MSAELISRTSSRIAIGLVVLALATVLMLALTAAIVPGAPMGGGGGFANFVP